MAKSGTLTVKVLGDAAPFEKTIGKVGKTAALAFAAVGTAAIAGAAKSVMAFTDFQGQMNEVFTLLPGISQGAMDDMSGQVKDFSKEFGVLPDKVVPALYQALSAGVPKDNVFEFLETAQMAAKGGVTELETAVDGISSVVNAYGDDVVSAAQASDLMFTAVKLGKTNFEELSATLSNVTPIASGLGVKFEDVSAGLASLTAKGTPTAQATTQLRSLFVELSKAGGKTANVFEDMAGKTFQEFIASGGNTADALDIMKKAADESGVQLQDLFGSVEAGAAALSLASGDSFTENIAEMGNAAGATEDAFDQMMTGLGPIFDKVKAGIAVFLIDVGEKLAPHVENAMEAVGKAFGIASDWWDDHGPEITAQVEDIKEAVVDWASDMRSRLQPALAAVGRFVAGTVVPALRDLGAWVAKNRPLLIGLAVAVGVGLTAAFTSWAIAAGAAAVATIAAAAPVLAIGAAIAGLVAIVVWAYQEWDVFRAAVDAVASFLTGTVWPAIKEGVGWLNDNLVPAIKATAEWFTDDLVPAVSEVVSWIADRLVPIIKTQADIFTNVVVPAIKKVADFFTGTLIPAVSEVVTAIKDSLGGAITTAMWIWTSFGDTVAAVWSEMKDVTITGVQFIVDAILGMAEQVVSGAATAFGWVPGLGDKLREAERSIATFRDNANAYLEGIRDKTVNINLNTVRGGSGASGPPVFHGGGVFHAPPGQREGFAKLLDGERVLSPSQTAAYDQAAGAGLMTAKPSTQIINLVVDGKVLASVVNDENTALARRNGRG